MFCTLKHENCNRGLCLSKKKSFQTSACMETAFLSARKYRLYVRHVGREDGRWLTWHTLSARALILPYLDVSGVGVGVVKNWRVVAVNNHLKKTIDICHISKILTVFFRDAENHAWDEFETLGMGWTWQETATASFLTLWGLLLTKIRKCWLKRSQLEPLFPENLCSFAISNLSQRQSKTLKPNSKVVGAISFGWLSILQGCFIWFLLTNGQHPSNMQF